MMIKKNFTEEDVYNFLPENQIDLLNEIKGQKILKITKVQIDSQPRNQENGSIIIYTNDYAVEIASSFYLNSLLIHKTHGDFYVSDLVGKRLLTQTTLDTNIKLPNAIKNINIIKKSNLDYKNNNKPNNVGIHLQMEDDSNLVLGHLLNKKMNSVSSVDLDVVKKIEYLTFLLI